MTIQPLQKVVIVGGGTAGWMCAAACARLLGPRGPRVTVVESDEIGTVGVGEATIPTLHIFNDLLGIDEATFLSRTMGTFKLGIEFDGWHRPGSVYLHPFGRHGLDRIDAKFHQMWLRLTQDPSQRDAVGDISDYNICAVASRLGRFGHLPKAQASALPSMSYAFHFDAGLYARFLRDYAEERGVVRVEGLITGVSQAPETGHITSVMLRSGQIVEGDLFIDCSGFRGLLIEETLRAGYQDWSAWLPCDRAVAVPCESEGELLPYTRAIADEAGWRWRIPLQHRTGNGYVYHSGTLQDDEAEARLMATLPGRALSVPRRLRFQAGHRKSLWDKNVIAIGLSGGFIEPLESTSIHLIQTGIMRLLTHFPDASFSPASRRAFNRLALEEYEQVRDLIILHYKANARGNLPFWRACRDMAIPDSLAEKIALFAETGRIARYRDELFTEDSWLAVMLGQGIVPQGHDPVVNGIPLEGLGRAMRDLKTAVSRAAEALPLHADFISTHCRATAGAS